MIVVASVEYYTDSKYFLNNMSIVHEIDATI